MRPDTGESVIFDVRSGPLDEALDRLDAVAEGAAYVLGHNLIRFDLPLLQAVNPHMRLFDLPAVDTLMLNPLAFPQNPYHRPIVRITRTGELRHHLVPPTTRSWTPKRSLWSYLVQPHAEGF